MGSGPGQKKVLLAAAALVSVTLSLALTYLWVRSFILCDSWVTSVGPELTAYQSYRGAVRYVHVGAQRLAISEKHFPPLGFSSVPASRAQVWQEWNGPNPGSYTLLGFAYANSLNQYTIMGFPYWLMVALVGLPAVWLVPRVLRRRGLARAVVCNNCGDRVRGVLAKCPRCGHVLAGIPPRPPKPPPEPRPTKKVQSVVVKTVTPEVREEPQVEDRRPL